MSFLPQILKPTAAAKHLVAKSMDYAAMFGAALNRKKHVPINTVQHPTRTWEDQTHTYVGGPTHDVHFGHEKQFVVALDRGHQIKKYNKQKNHHYEGDLNTLVPYKKRETSLSTILKKLW